MNVYSTSDVDEYNRNYIKRYGVIHLIGRKVQLRGNHPKFLREGILESLIGQQGMPFMTLAPLDEDGQPDWNASVYRDPFHVNIVITPIVVCGRCQVTGPAVTWLRIGGLMPMWTCGVPMCNQFVRMSDQPRYSREGRYSND